MKGKSTSSTADNILLTATANGHSDVILAQAQLSSLSVSIGLRNTGTTSSDNSGGRGLDGFYIPPNLGTTVWMTSPNRCVQAVEFVGTVAPSNYVGKVYLRRNILQIHQFGGTSGTTDKGQPYPPGPDDSLSGNRDDDPQSGNSGGKVYDFDSPGIGPNGPGAIVRLRTNFHEYASLTLTDTSELGSLDWFARSSCQKAADTISVVTVSDVASDNQTGTGTTKLTWNLQ